MNNINTKNEKRITDIIFSAIDDYNELNSNTKKIVKNKTTILYGKNGKLDSLGLVNLILSIEEQLLEKLGKNITLADDSAFSEKSSPFKNVPSLIKFIQKKLDD